MINIKCKCFEYIKIMEKKQTNKLGLYKLATKHGESIKRGQVNFTWTVSNHR